jgi:hypothetical protein
MEPEFLPSLNSPSTGEAMGQKPRRLAPFVDADRGVVPPLLGEMRPVRRGRRSAMSGWGADIRREDRRLADG